MDTLPLILNAIAVLSIWIGGFLLPPYLRKRSENLATKHDVHDITQRVEDVRAAFATLTSQSSMLVDLQLAAYKELLPSVVNVVVLTVSFFGHGSRQLSGKRLDEFRSATWTAYLRANEVYRRWATFLPSAPSERTVDVLNTYAAIAQHAGAYIADENGNRVRGPIDPVGLIQDSYTTLANSVRDELGIDRLSDRIRNEILRTKS